MKKRYLALAGILVLSLTAAGCGKKDEEEPEQTAQATVAPVNENAGDGDLVDMKATTEETITNVIGSKTATASQIVLINKTGDEIGSIYIRPNTDEDDEWGDELVQGAFTLKDGEKAAYYFEKGAKDEEGNTISLYDIRISYTDEEKNECFFRKLPLDTITQITLCMDGTGEDAIPYARYLTGDSQKETSTLKEVKQRLGLLDDDESEDEDENTDEDSTDTDTQDSTDDGGNTSSDTPQDPEPTQDPDAQDPEDPGQNPGTSDQPEDPVKLAESCIGKSLDELFNVCGQPNSNSYENEPETGETGYHYYDNFTVSTTVDEAGNEVVAGVW
ncbi:MAG: hypothetical protein Q4C91_13135 [Eubacteriales bacterium]|nr:hypothetical protein [Eubacteriales bacterium]